MKLHIGQSISNPYQVPEENYIGSFFRYRPAKKAFCRCPVEKQMRFDFSLIDSDGHDEGYLASATLCTNKRCQGQPHSVRYFLEQWLGDHFDTFLDGDDNIDLDRLLNRKADIQIVLGQPVKGHDNRYSKLEKALPRGTLIPR